MASPLVFGGFNGWTVVGDRLSYTVGRAEYDDFLVRGSWAESDAVLTTGVLTGAFSVGDPISLTFSSSALDSITIACLDSGGSVVASTTETIASTGVDLVVSEGMYRGAHYDTFVGNAEGYPATEIDFRFGYWIGVPMHKGKKT